MQLKLYFYNLITFESRVCSKHFQIKHFFFVLSEETVVEEELVGSGKERLEES